MVTVPVVERPFVSPKVIFAPVVPSRVMLFAIVIDEVVVLSRVMPLLLRKRVPVPKALVLLISNVVGVPPLLMPKVVLPGVLLLPERMIVPPLKFEPPV